MTTRQVRVFVVDDEPVIAWSLSDILRLKGFSAVSFTNPLDALRAALSDSPDLLISDISMPDLSGIQLAKKLKAMHLDCNIMLLSGLYTATDVLAEREKMAFDFAYLAKPVSPLNLLAEIHTRGWDCAVPC